MKDSDVGVKRILVVEDEPAICNLCKRVLSRVGFEVDIAVNGQVAQEMIEDNKYDLFLLDFRTPVMNGIELYQWLQGKYPQQASRVIFTTGSVMGGDASTSIEQTGRPLLPKPFNPEELKTIVKETLKEVRK